MGLAWLAFIDIERLLLPDLLTIGLLLAGLTFGLTEGTDLVLDRSIGALAGYAALALVAASYRQARGREGLGMGDAKLFAVGGAWLGWAALPLVLLMASIAAAAFVLARSVMKSSAETKAMFSFGPFIAAAIWMAWLLPVKQLPLFGLVSY